METNAIIFAIKAHMLQTQHSVNILTQSA